jgi:uncharacterized repeat protein (TIGR02543 family)
MDTWTMTCKKRALRFVLATLAVALLRPVAAAQGQNEKLLRGTTCSLERSELEYGVWDEFKSSQVRMERNALMNVMQSVSERQRELEVVTSYIEDVQFLTSLEGKDKALGVTKEILKEAGLRTAEKTFGLGGEVATTIYDVATSYSNPLDAGLFVVDQSFSIGKELVAIVEYGTRVPRVNTLIAFGQVMEANYRHCGNRQDIANALNIGVPNEAFFFDSQDEFLTWAVQEWGEENQNTDFFDFVGVDSGDNLYFYSSDKINDMVVEMRSEVDDIADSFEENASPEADPAIASVSPGSFVGQSVSQRKRIEIVGSGFSSNATLEFYNGTGDCDPCESEDQYLDVVNETTIEYEIATGEEADSWEVRVVDGSNTSNTGTFEVLDGTSGGNDGGDDAAPAAPVSLVATPNRPSKETGFQLNWENPSDASGIVAAWYKVGSAPSFGTDGTRLRLPVNKPFSVTVTDGGETPVYVWLEDGAGNKSSANRASVTVERDVTSPSVTIKEPIENWSQGEDPHIAENSTITLEGTASDSQSELVSVFWLNEATGQSGFGSFDGSNWTLADIPLADGPNAIGALVLDGAGNIGFDILGVKYNAPGENYTLDVSATNGTVEKNPDQQSYAEGKDVELTAKPDDGYVFDKWTGDVSGSENPLPITMDDNKSITANFVEDGGGVTDGPDLVVENLEVDPSEANIGEEIDIPYDVSNRGEGEVNNYTETDGDTSWEVAHYLSSNKTLDTGDYRLGEYNFPAPGGSILPPRRETGWKEHVRPSEDIPAVPAGTYYLLTVVDDNDEVSEASETNNVESAEITLTGERNGPDLVIEDFELTPSEVGPGGTPQLSYTVANRGNENVNDYSDDSWEVAHYLSDDRTLNGEDRRLGDEGFTGPGGPILPPRREPGWTEKVEEDEKIPSVSGGSYYIIAEVDAGGVVRESNEGNNVKSVSLSVVSENEPPTASNDTDETTSGQPVTTDVLTNDSDPDGSLDSSTVAVQAGPSNGSTTANSDGTITYTPSGGFTGTDSYTYTVQDNDEANSNEATVTITVKAGAPFITTWKTISSGESITIPTNGESISEYDFQVKWGDGTTEQISGNDPDPSHTYAEPGSHAVEITGTFPRIFLDAHLTGEGSSENANKLQSIDQWGSVQWEGMCVRGCQQYDL